MKKAEISSSQLIKIIILVLSFAIILLFLFLYPWGSTIDEETCHQTVVLRHTANIEGVAGAGLVPLKCQTGKICFVSGSFLSEYIQDCPEFKGIRGVEKVTVNNKEDIERELAGLMYRCWNTLGKGYLDYYPRGRNWEEKYCSPCYRVAFSEKTRELVAGLGYDELYGWMDVNKVPTQDKTYLQALYNIDSYSLIQDKEASTSTKFGSIDFSQEQVIITTATKEGWGKSILGGAIGLGVSIAALVISPFSGGASLVIPVVVLSGASIGSSLTEEGVRLTPPTIIPFKAESLQALECESDFVP